MNVTTRALDLQSKFQEEIQTQAAIYRSSANNRLYIRHSIISGFFGVHILRTEVPQWGPGENSPVGSLGTKSLRS